MYDEELNGHLTEEEQMDRNGTEVGFNVRKGFKKIGRGIKKGAMGVKKGVLAVAKAMTYPQRRLIRKFKQKIAKRRAYHLARKRGPRAVPNQAEAAEAKQWSNQWLKKRGGKFGVVLSKLSGDGIERNFNVTMDGDFIGVDPVTAGLLGLSIPVLYLLLNKLTAKAGREGAPPAVAPPAQDEGSRQEPQQEARQEAQEEAPAEESSESEGDLFGDLNSLNGHDFILGMTEEERMERTGSETDYDK